MACHPLKDRTKSNRIARREEIFRKADGSRFVGTSSGNVVETLKDSVNPETVEFQVCLLMFATKAV